MFQIRISLALLLVGGALLSACDGPSGTHTSTPSSMLGTDSAATKVGGTSPTDTTTVR
jgi:hypothetical protein